MRHFLFAVFLLATGWPCSAVGAGKADHVVVIVWDGMRRDFMTEQNTPTLHALSQEGVFFENHNPAYPSTTQVNGTAIATGSYPAHSRVIANAEFRRGIDPNKPVGTESLAAVRKGDLLTGGHYLNMPTVAEILQAGGFRTAVAGSKPGALLHDRAQRPDHSSSVNVYEGQTLPAGLHASLTNALGPFPEAGTTKTNRDFWTTRALVEQIWREGVPAFSLLWLAEPDYSQHATSPGSGQSLVAIRSSDANLARVIDALKARQVYDKTDIFVVSDHGFSTIERGVDLVASLKAGGFNAAREFKGKRAKGDVLVVGASAVLLYVVDADRALVERLVRFLQSQDYVGAIFTRERIKGAFRLKDAKLDSPEAPDIVFSMRWSNAKNLAGVEGTTPIQEEAASVEARKIEAALGKRSGTHGTLGTFDMRNTLVAAGPDFRRGFVNRLPTGNTDLAPTILWLLGLKPPKAMDGRVLSEALAIDAPRVRTPKTRRIEATNNLGNRTWRQYLQWTELNGVVYLDAANGAATPN